MDKHLKRQLGNCKILMAELFIKAKKGKVEGKDGTRKERERETLLSHSMELVK